MIELKQVRKAYVEGDSRHIVLDNLELLIEKGKIVILYGKSGSGKSTLLNIISAIDLPDTGQVRVNGMDLTSLSENERTLVRRQKIGFIFQFFNLIPTLTVEENLMLPLELNNMKEKSEKATELLIELDMAARARSYPDTLSGGEQQRVAIARALIHDPDIILADEPTGNLDYETGLQIVDILDRLVKQKGKTMIMVTHSRDVIGLADRVLSLKDGKLTDLEPEGEGEKS